MLDRRVCFDFDVRFSNGGGLQGQDFRLDIDGDQIDDDALAAFVIRDLRLLMVGTVRILNKRIIEERHKRSSTVVHLPLTDDRSTFVDLSRPAYGKTTSDVGTRISIQPIRSPTGVDPNGIALAAVADLPGVVIRLAGFDGGAIDWTAFAATQIQARAVLVNTGWDTSQAIEDQPFLTEKAARYLRDQGATLVGIDAPEIDGSSGPTRSALSVLLEAGIPVVECLTGLDRLPVDGFRFSAVPPGAVGAGRVPVRAYARLDRV